MTINDPNTETQAIIDELRRTDVAHELEPGRIYLVPNDDGGQTVIDTDDYAAHPREIHRTVTFHDVDSLTRYIKTYSEGADDLGAEIVPNSEVWISPNSGAPVVTAVLDPHGWRRHNARLTFELTPDWTDWLGISGDLQPQVTFAEFVEDHLTNFLEPDGATMLELAQSIRARTKSTFKSDRRLSNGQTQFDYTENVDASAGKAGTITIPDELSLALQPFVGAKTYSVTAKFRYRISEGRLSLAAKILTPSKIVDAVLDDVTAALTQQLPDALVLQGRI